MSNWSNSKIIYENHIIRFTSHQPLSFSPHISFSKPRHRGRGEVEGLHHPNELAEEAAEGEEG